MMVVEVIEHAYRLLDKCPDARLRIGVVFHVSNSEFSTPLLRMVTKTLKTIGLAKRPHVTVVYGLVDPFMVSLSKLISPFPKSRARVFLKREEAIAYVLKF